MTLGGFLRWIGIYIFLSTLSVFNRRSCFWSRREVSREDSATYRFHDWVSCSRFEEILLAIQYTNKEPPFYQGCFWEVWQMIDTWNKNIVEHFSQSLVLCLDESMSIWFNKFACPGWIFCPRKPRPFGNEYHSICCRPSGIMYAIELREGKDARTQKKWIQRRGCKVKILVFFSDLQRHYKILARLLSLTVFFVSFELSLLCKRWEYLPEPWSKNVSIDQSGLIVMLLGSAWRTVQLANVPPSEASSIALTMISFAWRSRSMWWRSCPHIVDWLKSLGNMNQGEHMLIWQMKR